MVTIAHYRYSHTDLGLALVSALETSNGDITQHDKLGQKMKMVNCGLGLSFNETIISLV